MSDDEEAESGDRELTAHCGGTALYGQLVPNDRIVERMREELKHEYQDVSQSK